jgi:hypothetical protein
VLSRGRVGKTTLYSQVVAKSPDVREQWRTEVGENSRRRCTGERVRTLADWRENTENLGVAGSITASCTSCAFVTKIASDRAAARPANRATQRDLAGASRRIQRATGWDGPADWMHTMSAAKPFRRYHQFAIEILARAQALACLHEPMRLKREKEWFPQKQIVELEVESQKLHEQCLQFWRETGCTVIEVQSRVQRLHQAILGVLRWAACRGDFVPVSDEVGAALQGVNSLAAAAGGSANDPVEVILMHVEADAAVRAEQVRKDKAVEAAFTDAKSAWWNLQSYSSWDSVSSKPTAGSWRRFRISLPGQPTNVILAGDELAAIENYNARNGVLSNDHAHGVLEEQRESEFAGLIVDFVRSANVYLSIVPNDGLDAAVRRISDAVDADGHVGAYAKAIYQAAVDGDTNQVADRIARALRSHLSFAIDVNSWLAWRLPRLMLNEQPRPVPPEGWEGDYHEAVDDLPGFIRWIDRELLITRVATGGKNGASDGRRIRNAYLLVDKCGVADLLEPEPTNPMTLNEENVRLRNIRRTIERRMANNGGAVEPDSSTEGKALAGLPAGDTAPTGPPKGEPATLTGNNELPPLPTRDFCLQPPNRICWQGSIEVEPRLYRLFELILDTSRNTESVHFDAIKHFIGNINAKDKTVQNYISDLSCELERIRFPWSISCKALHLMIDRGKNSLS